MSEAAFTRLADLLELGFHVDGLRSSDQWIVLNHAGSAPRIALARDGAIDPRGEPLWPDYLPYGVAIPGNDATLFGLWCQRIDQPTRWQNFKFHMMVLMHLIPGGDPMLDLIGNARWWAADLRERWASETK